MCMPPTVFLSPSPVTYPDEEGEVGPVQLCTLELSHTLMNISWQTQKYQATKALNKITTGTGESQVAMLNLSDQASVVKVTYDQTRYMKQRRRYRARKSRLAILPASQRDDATTVS